ncbi:exosome complex component RRP45-like [Babylonia areolata]|uniref:exosome complex component RRP45-like n=1 Tax=Babylonia areolata TaxID=304850 RepID=UPI003FCEF83B
MMRDFPLCNVEKEFLLGVIAENKRVDGRQPAEFRQIKIAFGKTFGTCEVTIGKTRVLAHVSGEISCPKARRPNEGVLHVNVDMSPMGHPTFEAGRQTDETVVLNRLLERCLKDSRCVDLEALCIVSGEKVWTLRVDITVLNHEGNILDCCCMAAIAALKHFRRPDVSVSGEEVTIHTAEQRDLLPLSVHHMPLCVTFAFFHQGTSMLVDPTEREERVMEGRMMIGQNKHREICMLQVTGQMLLRQDQVKKCTKMSLMKVMEMTNLIQQALANDKAARARGESCGFAVWSDQEKINSTLTAAKEMEAPPTPDLPSNSDSDSRVDSDSDGAQGMEVDDRSKGDVPTRVGQGVAVLGATAVEQWKVEDD